MIITKNTLLKNLIRNFIDNKFQIDQAMVIYIIEHYFSKKVGADYYEFRKRHLLIFSLISFYMSNPEANLSDYIAYMKSKKNYKDLADDINSTKYEKELLDRLNKSIYGRFNVKDETVNSQESEINRFIFKEIRKDLFMFEKRV